MQLRPIIIALLTSTYIAAGVSTGNTEWSYDRYKDPKIAHLLRREPGKVDQLGIDAWAIAKYEHEGKIVSNFLRNRFTNELRRREAEYERTGNVGGTPPITPASNNLSSPKANVQNQPAQSGVKAGEIPRNERSVHGDPVEEEANMILGKYSRAFLEKLVMALQQKMGIRIAQPVIAEVSTAPQLPVSTRPPVPRMTPPPVPQPGNVPVPRAGMSPPIPKTQPGQLQAQNSSSAIRPPPALAPNMKPPAPQQQVRQPMYRRFNDKSVLNETEMPTNPPVVSPKPVSPDSQTGNVQTPTSSSVRPPPPVLKPGMRPPVPRQQVKQPMYRRFNDKSVLNETETTNNPPLASPNPVPSSTSPTENLQSEKVQTPTSSSIRQPPVLKPGMKPPVPRQQVRPSMYKKFNDKSVLNETDLSPKTSNQAAEPAVEYVEEETDA